MLDARLVSKKKSGFKFFWATFSTFCGQKNAWKITVYIVKLEQFQEKSMACFMDPLYAIQSK